MHHYVYIVTDPITKEFYIGSRSCKCLPEEDVTYKGSPYQWKLSKEQKKRLEKEIVVSSFDSRKSCIEFEASLIKKHFHDPLNRNGTIPDGKYHTFGKVVVKNSNGEKFCVDKKDERYLSGELVNVNKGKKLSDLHKEKISWKGKFHKEETKTKISLSQKGKPRNHKKRSKKIVQLNLEGEIIQEWESLTAASNATGISCGNLSSGIKREKIRGGYLWQFKHNLPFGVFLWSLLGPFI